MRIKTVSTASVSAFSAVFLAISMLSGCATAPAQRSVAANIEESPVAVLPPLPNVELTADLLGDFLIAEVAVQRAQFDVSAGLYSRLARQTRDPRLAERATRVAVFARNYDAALETGQLWVELDPASLEGRQILTALLVKAGDYDAALGHLEALLKDAEGDDSRYMLIIRLLGREQDKDGALKVVEKFLARHPQDTAGLYAYAQLALRDGKLAEAERVTDQLLQLKPDWPQGVVLRTRVLQATNRETEALTYLGNVVQRHSDSAELRVAYGRMLVDAGRPEDALAQFQRVLKQDERNQDILFAAALVALRIENIDLARDYFMRLNKMGGRIDETSYYLGRIDEEQGKLEDAIRWYGQVEEGENYLTAQVRSAVLRARLGDVDDARAHLHAIETRSPGQRLRIFLAEGEILRDQGQDQEALVVYNSGLEEIPGNTELLYARAMVQEKLNRIDLLERDLLTILEREPDHVDALNSLGYTLADRTTRYEEALSYIKRAYELRPNASHILDSMGWVQYRLGHTDEAIQYLRRAMDANYDPEIAAHLGEVLWIKGDQKGARSIWDEALQKSPQNKLLMDAIQRLQRK